MDRKDFCLEFRFVINVGRRGERRAEADGCAALFLRDAIESFSFPQIMHRATSRAAGREGPERERETEQKQPEEEASQAPKRKKGTEREMERERESEGCCT